ncbi:hypothetical protein [Photorhabdus sp. CRCIA-P01]|uniref:hypothetical protein n=1 Tax=Photorhabdus sp. CRCIA-P01 TaxID=2019570 RepID=UPI000E59F3CE|nr:hypothetical protein [Photorhabdus sp. CRCIA-P01]
MVTKSEVSPDSVTKQQLDTLTPDKITQSIIIISVGTIFYRLQEGEHGGNGVFFNRDGGHTRYGLTNGTDGNLYLASSPRTSLSLHSDGLAYVSNVTLEPCIVLWHDNPSGKNVIRTEELKVLREFEYEGEIAEDILVNDLDIPVI